MAKVIFNCNSGANIHSCRTEEIDTVEDLGFDEGEWESMSEEDRDKEVARWALDKIEIYYTPTND